jgi:hypothetical protein
MPGGFCITCFSAFGGAPYVVLGIYQMRSQSRLYCFWAWWHRIVMVDLATVGRVRQTVSFRFEKKYLSLEKLEPAGCTRVHCKGSSISLFPIRLLPTFNTPACSSLSTSLPAF